MDLQIFDHAEFDSDPLAQRIANLLRNNLASKKGFWFFREPEIKTEGKDLPTFTILSRKLGLVFIRVYSYRELDLSEITNKTWVINNKKVRNDYSRFRNYVHKIYSRLSDPLIEFEEKVSIRTFFFFPYITDASKQTDLKCILEEDEQIVFEFPADFCFEELPEQMLPADYNLLVSIIQNANIINKPSNIIIDEPAKDLSEAIILNEKGIARFDYDQLVASLTITEKCERIRGLAGSGKTVLLAIKAAKLHYKFPDKKIAFVFFTKSLYTQATALIRKYYYQIAEDEPDWDNLKVLHSWGGKTTGLGFYSYICKENGFPSKRYDHQEVDCFARYCLDLANEALVESFDFVLIDEAQDFPLEFFQLVYKVTRAPKKIVIAYDELQSTSEVKIPAFEELFGVTNGEPNVILEPRFDYILKKSYRNTLEVLVSAFCFGFGFYDELTQMISESTTWEAFGFDPQNKLSEGCHVVIKRPRENSPNSISTYYDSQKPVEWACFSTVDENIAFIADKIVELITTQKVRPVDILVVDICMNKTHYLNYLQSELGSRGVLSHIPGLVTDARDFFIEGSVTLSTPRNAKGNEVPIVFVIGCEDIYEKHNMFAKRQARNFMFIAITRSKGWAYITANGRVKTRFQSECRKIMQNIPNIVFTYPNKETLERIAKINFLVDNPSALEIDNSFNKLKAAINRGDSAMIKHLIDLDPRLKEELIKLLGI